ncbi:MAG: PadR family transcriptional regulator [Vicinamibacterales bacterium]
MPAMQAFTSIGEFEQLVLLAVLQLGDEAYAVPVRNLIVARTGRDVARGALYTALERLEGKALVTSRVGEPLPERGGRPRRYFTVTPAGVKLLREARAAVANLSQGLESLLERP